MKRERIFISLISLGVVAGVMSSSILTVLFKDIADSFSITYAALQWRNCLFFSVFAVGVLFFGRIADRFSPRRQFVGGLLAFISSCAISFFAAKMGFWALFLAGQVLQAAADAAIVTSQLVLIRRLFPADRIGWAMGCFGAALSAASLLGPPIGGAIGQMGSWTWVFVVLAAIAAVPLLFVAQLIPNEAAASTGDASIPFMSFGLLLVLVLGLQIFVSRQAIEGLSVGILAGAGVLAGALLLYLEISGAKGTGVFPAGLWKNMRYIPVLMMGFLTYFIVMTIFLLVPTYLREVHGFSRQAVSLLLFVEAGLPVMLSPLGGKFVDRRPSIAVAAGSLFLFTALIGFRTFAAHASMAPYLVLFVLLGLSASLNMPAQYALALNRSEASETGRYMGAYQFFQFLAGGFAGALIAGSTGGNSLGGLLVGDFKTVISCLMLLFILIVWAIVRACRDGVDG